MEYDLAFPPGSFARFVLESVRVKSADEVREEWRKHEERLTIRSWWRVQGVEL